MLNILFYVSILWKAPMNEQQSGDFAISNISLKPRRSEKLTASRPSLIHMHSMHS